MESHTHEMEATPNGPRREAARLLFERNLEIYRDALATTQRLRERAVWSRLRLQQQGLRRTDRVRRLLIILRIDDGRLPDAIVPVVSGAPGFGGECDACDGYMPPTRLMMAIPHGDDTFAFLHADCYVIWKAQVHLRAALRHSPRGAGRIHCSTGCVAP